jgi:dTDP-4-amino-4,6-dideoxygalactose transaminase
LSSTYSKTIPVTRPSFGEQEETAVVNVLRSGWVAQGPRVAEFEARFAEYVGSPHAIAVSSCTTALHLALLTAGIRCGDEVICPSLSYIATANSIVHLGATPVFVDIDERTFNMDPALIEGAITPRTKAILAVHQIGMPAAMEELTEIASRRGLVVIEDAACAIGSEYRGRRIGSPHSAMACFSFHPRKILTTGEGGMITTSDTEVAARLRRLRQHAMSISDVARHSASKVTVESYDEVGYNYRMTDLQAAVGLVQLQRLDGMIARRRELAERYSMALAALPGVVVPFQPVDCLPNFQSYMVRLQGDAPIGRDELMQALLDQGISTRRGIMAIHREQPYRCERWDRELPVTAAVTDSAVILPLYHEMTDEDQDYVIACFQRLLRS